VTPYRPLERKRQKPRPIPKPADCLHSWQRIDENESRCDYCGDIRDDR
jgi:hypothetical protein